MTFQYTQIIFDIIRLASLHNIETMKKIAGTATWITAGVFCAGLFCLCTFTSTGSAFGSDVAFSLANGLSVVVVASASMVVCCKIEMLQWLRSIDKIFKTGSH